METLKYKRVLLKVSGEALAGEKDPSHRGIDFEVLESIAKVVRQCVDLGVQIGIVVGGGNFWRGLKDGKEMERTRADHMGMLPPPSMRWLLPMCWKRPVWTYGCKRASI